MTSIYEDAYSFLRPFLKPEHLKLYAQPDYLLEYYDNLNLPLKTAIIDYLPKPMPDPSIYLYEFDHDPNSTELKWRQNHTLYVEQYRRFLFTILGYFPHFYLDSTEYMSDDFEQPHLYKYDKTKEGAEHVDSLLLSSLKDFQQILISIPEEKTLLFITDVHVEIKTNRLSFIDFVDKIATINGLYLRNET